MSMAEITEATQYLTFKLDDEVFAIDISTVREVLEYTTVTKVPQTPDFIRVTATELVTTTSPGTPFFSTS